jgi:radical SAM protein with 4Fe4S-binding SPASM domain
MTNYDIIAEIDLDHWHTLSYSQARQWLLEQCYAAYKENYTGNQRIVFKQTLGDFYVQDQTLGIILRNLQLTLNKVDISSNFVILESANPNLHNELDEVNQLNTDTANCMTGVYTENSSWTRTVLDKFPQDVNEMYEYGSVNPLKVSLNELSGREQELLSTSKVFCIYPWIHLNANPDGNAYPCCMTDHHHPVGNCKTNTLAEIWNNDNMKKVRVDMLSEKPLDGCRRCYEQEESGFFSGRQSANKHHGHNVKLVKETKSDGYLDRFEMSYWDIRYSNLCNLKCRSCGHIYSSQWYQDQARLAGPEWASQNRVLNFAGRDKTDMWNQLIDHIDHVEQIYFAGGEPMLMDEHYNILDELDRRGRYDVRLVYNTNFTHTQLKDRTVFDYWKKFDSVSVGASLDGSDHYAEYIRKGTDWEEVERNRIEMLRVCPNVDFYVSSTLSIMNAWHLPDFHRNWVERGLIRAQDFNINILMDPPHYRIDIATVKYKNIIKQKFEQHLEWLRPMDRLRRATVGYESAIKFMYATNNEHLINQFWAKAHQLDDIRNENILEIIPELENLK